MGLIREPDGIDFFVALRPLTKEEETALSNFIKADKAKIAIKEKNKKKQVLNESKKGKKVLS